MVQQLIIILVVVEEDMEVVEQTQLQGEEGLVVVEELL